MSPARSMSQRVEEKAKKEAKKSRRNVHTARKKCFRRFLPGFRGDPLRLMTFLPRIALIASRSPLTDSDL
uniref:Uncharacterized protein n=1 Tax=Steinernema glaseri TaxID=37863 RepID=A0A1I7YM62_9BILA